MIQFMFLILTMLAMSSLVPSLVAQLVKNLPAMLKIRFLGWENPLEKG